MKEKEEVHFQCAVEPWFPNRPESFKTPPQRQCSDPLNLSVLQAVLGIFFNSDWPRDAVPPSA
jgi:hypothetical protein